MRIPVPLAWILLVLAFFTSGLLRQFNDGTPRSPYLSPVVGSLLFAAIVFLLLVAAREWRRGAVPGKGVRLGSVTPILLMLLIEKWISLTFYVPMFVWLVPLDQPPAVLDAQFRTMAGVGLLAVCVLAGALSRPTARKTWRRARPSRWLPGAFQVTLVIAATYGLLGTAAWIFGGGLQLHWPTPDRVLGWTVGSQFLLAFAEEVYFRGLLLCEMERLAPRLGARSPTARRWTALLFTSVLFGMEHIRLVPPWDNTLRQFVFTVALGLLFGLLVMISANLHLAGGVHAWINWLLLGAAPYFVDAVRQPALPAGTYIGLTLIAAFVMTFVFTRLPRRRLAS